MNVTYAADTSVSVERSRAELESLLSRYGADQFGYMTDPRGAIIVFRLNKKTVRFNLPLPDKTAKDFTHFTRGRVVVTSHQRSPEEAHKLWEQGCRSRWRSLVLCVKAKLEACSCGITTFEAEFLSHFVLENGETIGQAVLPKLDSIVTGKMPLLLGAGCAYDQ